jgi:hypothetical protein
LRPEACDDGGEPARVGIQLSQVQLSWQNEVLADMHFTSVVLRNTRIVSILLENTVKFQIGGKRS